MAATFCEIGRFELHRDAEATRARLIAAGIAATIPDTRVMGILPSCRIAPDDVRVLVPEDDYERARGLVDAWRAAAR